MEAKREVPSGPSTLVTPGTTGAPLFGFGGQRALKSERGEDLRSSSIMRNCHCFGFDSWDTEDGNSAQVLCLPPSPSISLARKVGAEFIGTLMLIFGGTATAIVNQKTDGSETLIGLAASTGLAVMIVILATGHISGAHLNPALTIAFAALKKFPWKHVPVYVGVQVVASCCAAFALKLIFHPVMGGGVTVPSGDNYGQAFALEFIITFNLMFVVTAVATDTRAVRELAGIAVGATAMLNILIAGETTGASMNPVRTLGPAIASGNYRGIWIYLTAPILGALFGAGVYTAIKLPDEGEGNQAKPAKVRTFRN